MPRLSSPLALTSLAAAAALTLAGCGGGAGADVEIGTEPPASFTQPSWALPIAPVGTWLTSLQNESVRVDVYQVAIAQSPEDSSWADGDTPLFVAGDPVVTLQYILTNVGETDVMLQSGEAQTRFNYAGSDLVSIPAEHHLSDLVESQGVSTASIDHSIEPSSPEHEMPLAAGESSSWATAYWYDTGVEASLNVEVPQFADGEWDYDNHVIDAFTEFELQAP
ncbi:hypothetical protein [Occultella kanbiaonis]|uniref:hypothetical protein n=1 Tax=Occultella kanbiaonis TaxID=2675754 RepID=UPI0013D154F5|nr:hypothetical protein [Occultella kanbiaonis]